MTGSGLGSPARRAIEIGDGDHALTCMGTPSFLLPGEKIICHAAAMSQPDVSLLLHCSKCGKDLPRGWFSRSGEGRRNSWCRQCREPLRSLDAARRRGAGVRVLGDWGRRLMMERQHHMCALCGGLMFEGDSLHVDHIVPIALGGWHGGDNLQLTHATCNLRKGTK